MRIALMGMGRLGLSLQQLLGDHTHLTTIAWRRNDPIPTDVDVYWICVSDGAIADVARQIPTGAIVLHSSGALAIDVLRPHTPAGSLHPLQSFPGPQIAIPPVTEVPAAISGDPKAKEAAYTIAKAIGFQPFEISGDRRAYHAAAVIAGNFATTLLAEASQLLVSAGVDPSNAPRVLAPLAMASIEQSIKNTPGAALTGPIARGDLKTVQAHLDYLDEGTPQLAEIYRLLGKAAVELLEKENRLTIEEKSSLFRLLG